MEQKKDNSLAHSQHNGHDSQGRKKYTSYNDVYFAIRKAEKLTTALYIVTDIVSDRDPIKWKMRDAGVELFGDVTTINHLDINERINMLRCVVKKIDRIVSFIDIAQTAHMMSDMNASILKKEYLALKDIIGMERERLAERSRSIFPESFFDIEKDKLMMTEEKKDERYRVHERSANEEQFKKDIIKNEGKFFKGQSIIHPERVRLHHSDPTTINTKGQSGLSEKNNIVQSAPTPTNVSTASTPFAHASSVVSYQKKETSETLELNKRTDEPRIHVERITIPREPKVIKEMTRDASQSATIAHDDRRKIILALIKQKPALTVKDISKSISGVSEKTIQRELLAMVADGLLTKKGERRWSTYSLRNTI